MERKPGRRTGMDSKSNRPSEIGFISNMMRSSTIAK